MTFDPPRPATPEEAVPARIVPHVAYDGTGATMARRPRVDGHALRARRTRERIVVAAQSLMRRGDLRPKAEVISCVARVSTRSVFQHFGTLGTLYAEAMTPDMTAVLAQHLRTLDDASLVAAFHCAREARAVAGSALETQ